MLRNRLVLISIIAGSDAGVNAEAHLDKVYTGLWQGLLSGEAREKANYDRLLTRTGKTVFGDTYAIPDERFCFIWLQQSPAIPLWATRDNCEILEVEDEEEPDGDKSDLMLMMEQATPGALWRRKRRLAARGSGLLTLLHPAMRRFRSAGEIMCRNEPCLLW